MFEKDNGGRIYFVEEGRNVPTKNISVMTAMKYLRKEREAYLAFVIDKRKKYLWRVCLL